MKSKKENNKVKHKKDRNNKLKILFIILITVITFSLIAYAGPAKAFVINLVTDKSGITKGGTLSFDASININSNENIPIQKLILELNGPEDVYCEFSPDGTIISGCKGMTITKISGDKSILANGYGYFNGNLYSFGYGYGYNNELKYRINLLTNDYLSGHYDTKLSIPLTQAVSPNKMMNLLSSNQNDFSENGPAIDIYPEEVVNVGGNAIGGDSCGADAWECTAWSACISNQQIRKCVKLKPECNRVPLPVDKKTCLILIDDNANTNTDDTIHIKNSQDPLNTTEKKTTLNSNFISGLTGASIAGISNNTLNTAIILLILLIVLVFVLFIILLMRNSRRMKRINQLRNQENRLN